VLTLSFLAFGVWKLVSYHSIAVIVAGYIKYRHMSHDVQEYDE